MKTTLESLANQVTKRPWTPESISAMCQWSHNHALYASHCVNTHAELVKALEMILEKNHGKLSPYEFEQKFKCQMDNARLFAELTLNKAKTITP